MRKIERQLDEMSEAMQSALKLTAVAVASLGAIGTAVGIVIMIVEIINKYI